MSKIKSSVEFNKAVIAKTDDGFVVTEYSKNEVVNQENLSEAFERLMESAIDIEGVKITMSIVKEENSNE